MEVRQRCVLCGYVKAYVQRGQILKAERCPKCLVPMKIEAEVYWPKQEGRDGD